MRSRIVIGLLLGSACIVAAGVYMAPTHEEIALMKLQDNHFHDALKYYTSLHAQGDASINVLAPLIKLNIHYGNIDEAIALVKGFITEHPRSVEGHKWLAELYNASQRFTLYCRELEILQTLNPETSNLRSLADTYDFLGRYQDEMRALARLVDSPGYHAKEEDYSKLASFYRVNGQPDDAIKAVLACITLKRYDVHIETMDLAAQLLLEKGDSKQAFTVSLAYLTKHHNEKEGIIMASLFRNQGKFDEAYALLTPFLGNIDHSPELLQELVTLQLAQGKQKEAYDLLLRQFAHGILPDALLVSMIDLAVKFNDYAIWEGLLQVATLENIPQEALLRYADLTLQLKRPDLAQIMRTRLGKEYMHEDPLLAAVLDSIATNTPESMAALLAISPDTLVQPEQKMIVANIYFHHGYADRAQVLFDSLPVADIFNVLDPVEMAELYLNAHETDKAVRSLNAARANNAPAVQARIDKALLFLAAGEGKTDIVRQWLDQHPENTNAAMDDAYYLSARHHHPEVALVLAQSIYLHNPTPKNHIQLAEALLMNRHYAEAIETIQPLTEHDVNARALYLEAMTQWIHEAGMGALGSNRETLNRFLTTALSHAELSQPEKRNIAWLLKETGFSDKAENLFFDLAANQSFASPDVANLLNFWGEHLPPRALAWVENRARVANDAEKAAWLHYLNDTGHPQSVVALLKDTQTLPPPLADVYIDALAALHETGKLKLALTQDIANESDPARLKHLAIVAQQEDLSAVSEQGWRRLHDINPDDSEAAKELGLLAYANSHYTEAKPLLEQYLNDNKEKTKIDYRASNAYAEILQHMEKKEQAKPYFRAAETQLAEIQAKDIQSLLDQAHLLYRNNQLEQSLDLYRTLLASYPKNKAVRADFAEVLIETKQFEEASLVLQ